MLAILTGLAVPAIDSVQKERLAREPVNRLALLAREVRGRAMTEERPYQILFDGQGFRASRFLRPYAGPEEAEAIRLDLEQIAEREEMIEASQARGIQVEEAAPPDPKEEQVREGLRYFQEYDYPADVQVSVRFWNDIEWVPLNGAEYKRWIFQPSGMCEPMRFASRLRNPFSRSSSIPHGRREVGEVVGGMNRVMGTEQQGRMRQGGYALLDVVLAVTLFAITVTGLLMVLRGIGDTSSGFARDRYIQQQLEGLLAEKRLVGLDAMASETLDELSGITFGPTSNPSRSTTARETRSPTSTSSPQRRPSLTTGARRSRRPNWSFTSGRNNES